MKKEKLSKYIEKKNDNTNHAAELKNVFIKSVMITPS